MGKENSYQDLQEDVRLMKLPAIEVWKNKYPERRFKVNFHTGEFTCVCPKTGLPDFAQLYIEYIPDIFCIELKSFKEYLFAYRDKGLFHEHVVNRILDDLVKSCQPRWMKVRGVFNVRGGITTTVESEYPVEGAGWDKE